MCANQKSVDVKIMKKLEEPFIIKNITSKKINLNNLNLQNNKIYIY